MSPASPMPRQILLITLGWIFFKFSQTINFMNLGPPWPICSGSLVIFERRSWKRNTIKEEELECLPTCESSRETHAMLRVLVKYDLKEQMGNLLFALCKCVPPVQTWECWVLNASFNVFWETHSVPLKSRTKTCSSSTRLVSLMTPCFDFPTSLSLCVMSQL